DRGRGDDAPALGSVRARAADVVPRESPRPLRRPYGFSRNLKSICRFVNETFEYRQETILISNQTLHSRMYSRSNSTRFSIFSSVSVSPRQPLICAQPVMPGFTLWRSM